MKLLLSFCVWYLSRWLLVSGEAISAMRYCTSYDWFIIYLLTRFFSIECVRMSYTFIERLICCFASTGPPALPRAELVYYD